MNRRKFIRSGALAASSLAVAGNIFPSPRTKVLGANERIKVGVIGFRSHGKTHIRAYRSIPGVQIAGLCDVDKNVLDREVDALDRDGIKVQAYTDLRSLLDNQEIDAVSIATPNHWHALAAVWACQAGKDVCVEKPVSHCIWEGRKIVEAARKYGRMVQGDLDSRSLPDYDAAFKWLQDGNLGKFLYVRAFDYKRRGSIGKINGPQKIPAHIDYNLWTGPAPALPLLRPNLHYDWHWQWATGNGEIGNNGPHQLDLVRWALGQPNLPVSVLSFGARFGYEDAGQTPNTIVAYYDYNGIPLIYEARGLPEKKGSNLMDGFVGASANGTKVVFPHEKSSPNDSFVIFCEHGYYHKGVVYDNDGKVIRRFDRPSSLGPQANFIKGVRSRKIEDLKTDILEGHLSTSICHMGNISIMCGEPISFSEAKTKLDSNQHLISAFDSMKTHLKANAIDVDNAPLILGKKLSMNSKQELFTGAHSENANMFLKNSYRAPFIIPEQV